MTDWEKIRTGFVKDGLSYRALSREFAAPYSTIQRRGIRRGPFHLPRMLIMTDLMAGELLAE